MCGRYSLSIGTPADLRQRFPLGEQVVLPPRFNIAPGDDVLTVLNSEGGEPEGAVLRWGLVPHWAEDPKIGFRLINARSETVDEKPAFRQTRPCLVVADGFFEWERLPDGSKQPHWITRPDRAPFAFAGRWTAKDDLRTCTILTTAARGPVARIHDRMPVVLTDAGEEAAWLDGAPVPPGFEELDLTPVGHAVDDARHDAPDVLEPAEPPPTLF